MKSPLRISIGIAVVALLLPSIASSAVGTALVSSALQTTVIAVTSQLQTLAVRWLSIFMLAQFLITNLGLLKSGADIEAVWGKFAGSLMWFGFCFYLVDNGSEFIKKVGGQMFMEAGTISGAPGIFTAGNTFDWGLRLCRVLMAAVDQANGGGWFPSLDFLPSLLTFVSCLIILAVSALIGFKIFIIKIELMITVMMAPLSFSFMALSSLKDQGMAPFKSLISLIYRVMILAVIVSAMDKVGIAIEAAFKAVGTGAADQIWDPVFASLMVFSLFGYLAFKSDSMAANLASGSTSLGTGDVAQAAAAGAAAGAAIATGGAAAVAGGSKATQAMGDFMKGLGGGGGAIKNASTQGSGGSTAGTPPARPAALSAGTGGFSTNKSGAPVKDSNAGKEQGGSVGPGRADSASGGQQAAGTASGGDAQQSAASVGSAPENSAASGGTGKSAGGVGAAGTAAQGDASGVLNGGTSGGTSGGEGAAAAGAAASGDTGRAAVKPPGPAAAPPSGPASPAAPVSTGRKAPVRPASPAAAGAGTAAGAAGKSASGNTAETKPAGAGSPVALTKPASTADQSAANPAEGAAPPVSPTAGPTAGASGGGSPTGPGSGANAGISGPTSPLEQKVDKLLENASQAPKRPRPTLSDRLGTVNEHVARESAATHVSINVNAD